MQNTDGLDEICRAALTCIRTETDEQIRSEAFSRLCTCYRPLLSAYVKRFSASPYAVLAELEQEAYIALYRAALTYESDRHTTFGLYAGICIRNRLISCLRREARAYGKTDIHTVLCDARVSVYPANPLNEEDPGEQYVHRDMFREAFDRFISSLTDLEKQVFTPYIRGVSYKKIAEQLSLTEKSVDNAVYRIRVKLKRALSTDL